MNETKASPGGQAGNAVASRRREATAAEAKALGHPLRLRILRLCTGSELTNKQLAVKLSVEPGTTLYHVRQLVNAGFLSQGEVRTGQSGALEKPYRSTNMSWWLNNPLAGADVETRTSPVSAFQAELEEAGPDSIQTIARFVLHLSPAQLEELDRKILAVLDDYIASDGERQDQPAHGGMFILHRLAGQTPAPGPGTVIDD